MRETEEPYEVDDEEAAAAEAGQIGGPRPDYYDADEAQRPLVESGEGEEEGFELAEEDLIEEATHGDEKRDPEVDGWDEAEEADVEYGEADEEEEPDL